MEAKHEDANANCEPEDDVRVVAGEAILARPTEAGLVLAQVLDHRQDGIWQAPFEGRVVFLAHLVWFDPVESLVVIDIDVDPFYGELGLGRRGGRSRAG